MAAEKILRIDPKDNVLVALTPLPAGEPIAFAGEQYVPLTDIPAKQKFAMRDLAVGDEVIMYGGNCRPCPGANRSRRSAQHPKRAA